MSSTPTGPKSNPASNWKWAFAITLFALLLRLIFLFGSPDRDWPHSVWYEGDAPLWVEYATALDKGEAFELGLPIHQPAVAYAIRWFYPGVREHGFIAFKVMWCVMSAATCGLLFLAVAKTIGHRTAFIASILCSISFGQLILATSINSETPYTFLLCAMVLITPRAVNPTNWATAAFLGVLHGLAMLFRPEHLLLIAMWCVWMAWLMLKNRRASGSRGSLRLFVPFIAMTAGIVITCLPWTIRASRAVHRFNTVATILPDYDLTPVPWTPEARTAFDQLPAFARSTNFNYLNFLASQRGDTSVTPATIDSFFADEFGTTPKPLSPWVIVSNQGGISFALANHPKSDGGFTRHALEHPKLIPNPTFNISFPPHLELLNDGYRIGWTIITDDVGHWLRLVGKKLERFAGGITLGFTAANLPIGREGVRHPVDMMTAAPGHASWWSVTLLLMIVGGMVIALARRSAGVWLIIIVNKLIVTILFYGYARQGASIGPAFFVMMALLIEFILTLLTSRWPRLSASLPWIGCAVVMIALSIDLRIAITAQPLRIHGNLIQRPEFGPGAFTSYERIELKPW